MTSVEIPGSVVVAMGCNENGKSESWENGKLHGVWRLIGVKIWDEKERH